MHERTPRNPKGAGRGKGTLKDRPKASPNTTRNTVFKKLPAKKQVFVQGVVSGLSATEAALEAGFGGPDPLRKRRHAAIVGNKLMNLVQVQNAIQEKLREKFPNGEETLAKMLKEILEYPLDKMGYKDCPVKTSDKLRAAEFYLKILGLMDRPKETIHTRRSLTLSAKMVKGQGEEEGGLLPKRGFKVAKIKRRGK